MGIEDFDAERFGAILQKFADQNGINVHNNKPVPRYVPLAVDINQLPESVLMYGSNTEVNENNPLNTLEATTHLKNGGTFYQINTEWLKEEYQKWQTLVPDEDGFVECGWPIADYLIDRFAKDHKGMESKEGEFVFDLDWHNYYDEKGEKIAHVDTGFFGDKHYVKRSMFTEEIFKL